MSKTTFINGKWKLLIVFDSLWLHGLHAILQARILKWVAFSSPGDLSNLGIEPKSSLLQADSLPVEPQGKPTFIHNI